MNEANHEAVRLLKDRAYRLHEENRKLKEAVTIMWPWYGSCMWRVSDDVIRDFKHVESLLGECGMTQAAVLPTDPGTAGLMGVEAHVREKQAEAASSCAQDLSGAQSSVKLPWCDK